MTSPPPPTEGDDCFPVLDCDSELVIRTFIGTGTGGFAEADKPIQLFIDADDRPWLLVIEYGWHPTDGIKPLRGRVWRSDEVLDCEEIRAAGFFNLGAVNWVLVCDSRYDGWTDEAVTCCPTDCETMFDFGSVSIDATFFEQRTACCDETYDICNPPRNACPLGECLACVGDNAPNFITAEISAGADRDCTFCDELNGSYVLDRDDSIDLPLFLDEMCVWSACFPVSIPGGGICGGTIQSVRVAVGLAYDGIETTIGGWLAAYNSTDCSGSPIISEYWITPTPIPGQLDCLALDRYLNFATPVPTTNCDFGVSLMRVRAT